MATGVAQQYGCALDSAVERAQAERINAIARIRARSGRCANQGGRVGDRETNARQLMEIEERPGIREAWFPGRKRPVCSGERTVNGPASPQPISMTEPPSRGLPGDRPVVYSRGLGDPRFFRQPSSARMLWARGPRPALREGPTDGLQSALREGPNGSYEEVATCAEHQGFEIWRSSGSGRCAISSSPESHERWRGTSYAKFC